MRPSAVIAAKGRRPAVQTRVYPPIADHGGAYICRRDSCRDPARAEIPIPLLAHRLEAGAPITARHLGAILAEELRLRTEARLLAVAEPSATAAIEEGAMSRPHAPRNVEPGVGAG